MPTSVSSVPLDPDTFEVNNTYNANNETLRNVRKSQFFAMAMTTYLSFSLFLCCTGTTACLRVRLADGPGRCAGRLEMKVAGDWYRVGKKWSETNSHVACEELSCGRALLKESLDMISPGSLDFLTKQFNCEPSHNLSSCPSEDIALGREDQKPTTLVCEGQGWSSSALCTVLLVAFAVFYYSLVKRVLLIIVPIETG